MSMIYQMMITKDFLVLVARRKLEPLLGLTF
jgi:hypothetical protein